MGANMSGWQKCGIMLNQLSASTRGPTFNVTLPALLSPGYVVGGEVGDHRGSGVGGTTDWRGEGLRVEKLDGGPVLPDERDQWQRWDGGGGGTFKQFTKWGWSGDEPGLSPAGRLSFSLSCARPRFVKWDSQKHPPPSVLAHRQCFSKGGGRDGGITAFSAAENLYLRLQRTNQWFDLQARQLGGGVTGRDSYSRHRHLLGRGPVNK